MSKNVKLIQVRFQGLTIFLHGIITHGPTLYFEQKDEKISYSTCGYILDEEKILTNSGPYLQICFQFYDPIHPLAYCSQIY